MSTHLTRQANRAFALAAVAVLAVLLLQHMGWWKLLIPAWLVAWVTVQIALQHVATRPRTSATQGNWHVTGLFLHRGKAGDVAH